MMETTNKMIEAMNESMKVSMAQMSISEMDENSFKAVKADLKLTETLKELMLEYAKMMDAQNKKLDLILSKLDKAQ